MAKVMCIAVAQGYDGICVRQEGEQFEMDESVFKHPAEHRDWFRRAVERPVKATRFVPEGREMGDPAPTHKDLGEQGDELV